MRSPFLEQRNHRIRRTYSRLVTQYRRAGLKKPGEKAVQECQRIFNAHALSYDTLVKICRDKNYSSPSRGQESPPAGRPDPKTTQKRAEDDPGTASPEGGDPQEGDGEGEASGG